MISDSDHPPSSYPIHGYFLDGKSPRQQNVSLRLVRGGLKYRLCDSGKIQAWKFAATDWAQSPLDAAPLALKSAEDEDAWLVVTDAKAILSIREAQKNWGIHNFWVVHAEIRTLFLYFASVMAVLIGFWGAWPFVADRLAASAPPVLRSRLDGLGESALAGEKKCVTPEATLALSVLQARLAQDHPQLTKLKLIIIDKGMVNAFTLPGNQVVLTRGLIGEARNDDEVAGVLAHEFGHVLNDHVVRGFLRSSLPKLVVASLGNAFGSSSLGLANFAIGNAYNRSFEHDADAAAIVLLRDAKVSPKGLEDFFNRLESKKGNWDSVLVYLSDHPPSKDRAAMMAAAAESDAAPNNKILTDEQWNALKNACGNKSVAIPARASH